MAPKLYYHSISGPSRAVMMTAQAMGFDLELEELDLLSGQQRSPEFLELNPQHCVPTMVEEDGFVLWESCAISSYLVDQYGTDDSLYPKDPKTRFKVDRLLYFDVGTLYTRFMLYAYPIMMKGEEPSEEALAQIKEALSLLDGWLTGQDWAAGDNITIADHSISASLATIRATGIDLSEYPEITAYLERCESEMPGFKEMNVPGAETFGNMVLARMPKKDDE